MLRWTDRAANDLIALGEGHRLLGERDPDQG
jgi:hypothetical protein